MTDAEAQAAWRWVVADEQARAVLTDDAPRRIPAALVLGALAVVIVALVVTAVTLPSDAVGRYVFCMTVACLGLCAVVVDLVVGVIARRRGTGRDPVVKPLSRREQSAVRRAITGRVAAPENRLVVRAAAVQTATGAGLVSASGRLLVFTALSVSSTALWFVYVVVAALAFVALVVVVHQVAAARRYLDAHPAHATI